MDKRSFLKKTGILGISALPMLTVLDHFITSIGNRSSEDVAQDEDFWAGIRQGYRLKPDYINLENGYYCIIPEETLEHYIEHVREVNYQGAYYMRTVLFDNKKLMSTKLATLAGCSADELIITRNATESLDMIIGGMHWREGDEAVMAEQDYGAMLDMFKLIANRYGVVNKIISVPNHPTSDEQIVKFYESAITPKTKLLMVCHMINITGQILPIRKICDMARQKGVPVLVDGAHAFAHIQFSIADLNCDYYAASLHKWLSVPLGAGMLYVRKGNVNKIWPLLADSPRDENDIARLNHIGTHPVHTDLAIANAIDYYIKLGPSRKESRLRYLQQYWTSKVRDLPHVIVNTPVDPARSCGIANVGIKEMKPAVLAELLIKKYKIYTVAIDGAEVQGCRVTPNLFTTLKELNVLIKALQELR